MRSSQARYQASTRRASSNCAAAASTASSGNSVESRLGEIQGQSERIKIMACAKADGIRVLTTVKNGGSEVFASIKGKLEKEGCQNFLANVRGEGADAPVGWHLMTLEGDRRLMKVPLDTICVAVIRGEKLLFFSVPKQSSGVGSKDLPPALLQGVRLQKGDIVVLDVADCDSGCFVRSVEWMLDGPSQQWLEPRSSIPDQQQMIAGPQQQAAAAVEVPAPQAGDSVAQHADDASPLSPGKLGRTVGANQRQQPHLAQQLRRSESAPAGLGALAMRRPLELVPGKRWGGSMSLGATRPVSFGLTASSSRHVFMGPTGVKDSVAAAAAEPLRCIEGGGSEGPVHGRCFGDSSNSSSSSDHAPEQQQADGAEAAPANEIEVYNPGSSSSNSRNAGSWQQAAATAAQEERDELQVLDNAYSLWQGMWEVRIRVVADAKCYLQQQQKERLAALRRRLSLSRNKKAVKAAAAASSTTLASTPTEAATSSSSSQLVEGVVAEGPQPTAAGGGRIVQCLQRLLSKDSSSSSSSSSSRSSASLSRSGSTKAGLEVVLGLGAALADGFGHLGDALMRRRTTTGGGADVTREVPAAQPATIISTTASSSSSSGGGEDDESAAVDVEVITQGGSAGVLNAAKGLAKLVVSAAAAGSSSSSSSTPQQGKAAASSSHSKKLGVASLKRWACGCFGQPLVMVV